MNYRLPICISTRPQKQCAAPSYGNQVTTVFIICRYCSHAALLAFSADMGADDKRKPTLIPSFSRLFKSPSSDAPSQSRLQQDTTPKARKNRSLFAGSPYSPQFSLPDVQERKTSGNVANKLSWASIGILHQLVSSRDFRPFPVIVYESDIQVRL